MNIKESQKSYLKKEKSHKKTQNSISKPLKNLKSISRNFLKITITFLTLVQTSLQIPSPGPGKWPLIDLIPHEPGSKITNLCSRLSANNITPSTPSNIKDQNQKFLYKFLWTAWIKLPPSMVMKRYDYDPNFHPVVPTKEHQLVYYSSAKSLQFKFKYTHPFIVNDLTKFNSGMSLENCYTYDDSVAANCNSAKLCQGNKFCTYRCPKTPSLTQLICNQDHIKRCKTVGTGKWFFMQADYTILEPENGDSCKIEFSNFRASPTNTDSNYGTTDCSDYSTEPLRLHSAFATNRGDSVSVIREDADEVKLQPGYENVIVKKMTSAFVVLDKNELYITGRGNSGSDLEILMEDVKNFHYFTNFYTYMLSGEPTLFKIFDFTRWDTSILSNYVPFYKAGTDAHKKFLFENYSSFGYPINPDQDMPDVSPFTGGGSMYERMFEISGLPLIDQENGDFCASIAPTVTIVRNADGSLNPDGSNMIILQSEIGFKETDFTSGHRYHIFFITIKRQDANTVLVFFRSGDTPETFDTTESTTTGDFSVPDGILIGQLSYSSTWPGTGQVELMIQITICPTDYEPSSTSRFSLVMLSLTVKDSELPLEKISAKPIRGLIANIINYITGSSYLKTIGFRFSVRSDSAKAGLGFYVTNVGAFKGGSSPLMLDRITTDTTKYPEYTFWKDHFNQNHPFTIIGGSRTTPQGIKHPEDKIFFTRCSNNLKKTFLSGDAKECLEAQNDIPGCLRYRADITDPLKPVCERCEESGVYWLDKINFYGKCDLRKEDYGVDVNCDMGSHNHYKQGQCDSCGGDPGGCFCNGNQVKQPDGTCSCSVVGCGICFESGVKNCQFCFPSNVFFEHPDDTLSSLVCVQKSLVNFEHPGRGIDKTRSPPSLIPCTDGVECQFCQDDATNCTKCSGTNPENPGEYFSLNGDCVLQSSFAPRTGFDTQSSYEWRVFPCESPNCGSCYTNYKKCTSCDATYFLHDITPESTTCTHESQIPPGFGKTDDLTKIIECLTQHCSNCNQNYKICEKCKNFFWLNSTENSLFCQKICEFREFYLGKKINECEKCVNGCQNCKNITGECEEKFSEADFFVKQIQPSESILDNSDITLKIDILYKGNYPNLDVFNYENKYKKRIFRFFIVDPKETEVESYTTRNSEGRLESKISLKKFVKNEEKNQDFLLKITPFFWNDESGDYGYPSVNLNPMINLKNETKFLKILYKGKNEFSPFGEVIGTIGKFSGPSFEIIAIVLSIFSLDPNGYLLRFSQFLSIVNAILFINVDFGKEILGPFLEMLNGVDERKYIMLKKENRDEIWQESKKYRGKFTKYSVSLKIQKTFLIHSFAYSFSTFIKYIAKFSLYLKISSKKKIGKKFLKFLKIQRSTHLTIFSISSLKIWFYGTRIFSHLEENYLRKLFIMTFFFFLIVDTIEIILDGIKAVDLILKKKNISEEKNTILKKNRVAFNSKKNFFKGIFLGIDKVEIKSLRDIIHPGRFKATKFKDKLPRMKITKKTGEKKISKIKRNESKKFFSFKNFFLKKKFFPLKKIPLLKKKDTTTLQDSTPLAHSHANPYLNLNLASTSLLLTTLNQKDKKILRSTIIKFSNLHQFLRDTFYQISIPTLTTLPLFLISILAIIELIYFFTLTYNYLKKKNFQNFLGFFSKISQSFFFSIFNIVVIFIFLKKNRDENFGYVPIGLQIAGVILLTFAIFMEYFILILIFLIFLVEKIMICKGKKIEKIDKNLLFGFDFEKKFYEENYEENYEVNYEENNLEDKEEELGSRKKINVSKSRKKNSENKKSIFFGNEENDEKKEKLKKEKKSRKRSKSRKKEKKEKMKKKHRKSLGDVLGLKKEKRKSRRTLGKGDRSHEGMMGKFAKF